MNTPPVHGVEPPGSLYVHFPFCVHHCHYCDFSVHRTGAPALEEWLECLDIDLDGWFQLTGWDTPTALETVFIGGGTPSLIGSEMGRLADVLKKRFLWDPASVEWTAESNPASLSRAVAEAWREAGVTRLSVGVQSFDDAVLLWLGRLHNASGARRALAVGRSAGFDNINADLIFGLPESVPRDWHTEVDSVLEAGVTHVSAYGLTAEPRTSLGRRVESGDVRMVDGERYAEEYLSAVEALDEAGYVQYEVSSFAQPGHESRHNWHYWDGSSYLGLGPSAHSYMGGVRLWNVFRWEAYRRALKDGASAREDYEVMGAGEIRMERLWLAFRTNRGLLTTDPLWQKVWTSAGDLLEAWREAGWVVQTGDSVRFSVSGWLRMDELVAALGARMQEERHDTGSRDGDGFRKTDRT